MVKPAKAIKVTVNGVNPVGFIDDASIVWNGNPYQWDVEFGITSQAHGFYDDAAIPPIAGAYDGSHIAVGDWVVISPGLAAKIVAIPSWDYSSITCTVEDVGYYNVLNSPSGEGFPSFGDGFIFELDTEGKPILTSVMQGVIDPTIITDVMNRFEYLHRDPISGQETKEYTGATVSSGIATLNNFFANAPLANSVKLEINGVPVESASFSVTGENLEINVSLLGYSLESTDFISVRYDY